MMSITAHSYPILTNVIMMRMDREMPAIRMMITTGSLMRRMGVQTTLWAPTRVCAVARLSTQMTIMTE